MSSNPALEDSLSPTNQSEDPAHESDSDLLHDCDCEVLKVRRYINHRGQRMTSEIPEAHSRMRGIGSIKSSYRQQKEENTTRQKVPDSHWPSRLQDWTVRRDLSDLDMLEELDKTFQHSQYSAYGREQQQTLPDFTALRRPPFEPVVPNYSGSKAATEYFSLPRNGLDCTDSALLARDHGVIAAENTAVPAYELVQKQNVALTANSNRIINNNNQSNLGLDEVPLSLSKCEECKKLKRKVNELEECNKDLKEQNTASLKIIHAINNGNSDNVESAIIEENALLKDHLQRLNQKLDRTHRVSYQEVKDKFLDIAQEQGKITHAKAKISEDTIEKLSNQIMQERLLLSGQQSESEARLLTENVKLKSQLTELTHSQSILEIKMEESRKKNAEIREKYDNLLSTIPDTGRFYLELDDFDAKMFDLKWVNLPEGVVTKLESGQAISEKIQAEENIYDQDGVVQCLWYRYIAVKKALSQLENGLEKAGISSSEALNQLQSFESLITERDLRISDLEDQLLTMRTRIDDERRNFQQEIETSLKDRNEVTTKLRMSKERVHMLNEECSAFREIKSLENNNMEKAMDLLSMLEEKYQTMMNDKHEIQTSISSGQQKLHTKRTEEQSRIQELENSLEVYKIKVIKLSEENHRMEDSIKQMKECNTVEMERNSIASNFDNLNRRWNEEKNKADRLQKELEKCQQQLSELKTVEVKCRTLEEDRNGMKNQIETFASQLSGTYESYNEKLAGREEDIRKLIIERDSLKTDIQQLTRDFDIQKEELIQEAQRRADDEIGILRKELDLLQRRSSGFEHEKENLLEQLKHMGIEVKEKEATVQELRDKCSRTIKAINEDQCGDTLNIYTDPKLRNTKEALEDLSLLLRNTHLEFTEAKQTIKDLQKDTLYRFSNEYEKHSAQNDDLSGMKLSNVTLQSEIRTLRDQNKSLKMLLQESKESNADLREKLRIFGSQSTGEFSDLRQAIRNLTERFESERLNNQLLSKTKSELEQKWEMNKVEMEALKSVNAHYDQLKTEMSEIKIKYDLLRETNNILEGRKQELEERLNSSVMAQTSSENTLRQLQQKCSELLKDNEELEKISEIGDDKTNTLMNIVEKLKNRIDNLNAAKKTLTRENQAITQKLKRTEDELLEHQRISQTQITQLRNMLDQAKKDLKSKTTELSKNGEVRHQLDDKIATMKTEIMNLQTKLSVHEGLDQEHSDAQGRMESIIAQLREKLAKFEEQESRTPRKEIMKQLEEARRSSVAMQSTLKEKQNEWKLKEMQMIDRQRSKLAELDTTLAQERSQHAIAKSKCVSLEDEVDFLRSQVNSYRKRELANTQSNVKSREDQVNDLILKSQSKAHHLLLANPELVRSLTPEGRMLTSTTTSPTASFTRFQLD